MSLDSRNSELNKKINETDLPDAVNALILADKRRKRQVRWLTVSIALDVLLTIALAFLSIQTNRTANQSESNHSALVRTCESTNEGRANNRQIWNYLLNAPTPNAPTIQQQQVRKQFAVLIDKTFAPRDCSKL